MTNGRQRIVIGLVFCSGAAGLVYQLLYIKLAVLVFGATVDALSAVTSAFVAGLALGSAWAGRVADRAKSPLLVYGVLEGLIGLYSIGLPLYFETIGQRYVGIVHFLPDAAWTITSLRILLSGAVVLIPTWLMGASVPLAARHCIHVLEDGGPVFSRIYSSNTLGAAFGVLACTFWLLPRYGVWGTLLVAVSLNVFVMLAVVLTPSLRRPAPRTDSPRVPLATASPSAIAPRPNRVLRLVVFFSGFLVLSLEVVWAHLLHLTVGGSEYVVGTILFAILMGLGAGSALLSLLLRRGGNPVNLMAGLLALCALAIATHLPVWNELPEAFVALGPFELDFFARELTRFGMTCGAVFVPSLFVGTIFPLTIALALRDERSIGRSVGALYAINSLGSIVGPLVAGFWMLPALGSLDALRLHIGLYLALALLVVARERRARKGASRRSLVLLWGSIISAALLCVTYRSWDMRPLTSGANVYFSRGFADYDKLLWFRESVHGGVTTVIEQAGERTLLTDGKFQGTTGKEAFFQKSMALVPLAILRDFHTALNIGLGTGQTLATMASAPFEHIDVAEISHDVTDAARIFFSAINKHAMDDPRVQIHAVDGRNFLLLHPERRYDLITVQISSIWLSGMASLYDTEFYRLCRARLGSRGILQQWLQLHHMRRADQLTVISTLAHVFPHVALYRFSHQAILLASNAPLSADYRVTTALERRLTESGDLNSFRSPHLFSVFAYHYLDNANIRRLLRDAIPKGQERDFISSDLRPLLAYGTPRGVAEVDSADRFYADTAAYGFTPLSKLVGEIPSGAEYTRLLDILRSEWGESAQPVSVTASRETVPAPVMMRAPLAPLAVLLGLSVSCTRTAPSPAIESGASLVDLFPRAEVRGAPRWQWSVPPSELAANPTQPLAEPGTVLQPGTIDYFDVPTDAALLQVLTLQVRPVDVAAHGKVAEPMASVDLELADRRATLGSAEQVRLLPLPLTERVRGATRYALTYNTYPDERAGRLRLQANVPVVVEVASMRRATASADLESFATSAAFAENPGTFARRKYLDLAGAQKKAILAEGDDGFAYALAVPRHARLEGSYGVVANNGFNSSASFEISFTPQGAAAQRLFVGAASRAASDAGRWRDFSVDLGEFAGDSGKLLFQTRTTAGDRPLMAWGRPLIHTTTPKQKRNLLVITIDALDVRHTSLAGYARDTTPFLAALRARALYVPSFITHFGMTNASLSATLHSSYGLNEADVAGGAPEPPSLFSVLKAQGYITQMISNMETGELLASTVDAFQLAARRPDDRTLLAEVSDLFQRYRNGPLAIWVHLNGGHVRALLDGDHDNLFVDNATLPSRFPDLRHVPVWKEKIELTSSERERITLDYDRRLRQVDDYLRAFFARAVQQGWLDGTLVVVTADHGEEVFEHRRHHHGHGVLYDSVLRVPLLWIEPDGQRAGHTLDVPVGAIDLAPSLLDYLHVQSPKEFLGQSFLPIADHGNGTDRFTLSFQPCGRDLVAALRSSRYKLIFSRTGCQPAYPVGYTYAPSGEVYDLRADPAERNNLATQRPELVSYLRRKLDEALDAALASPRERRSTAGKQLVDVMRMAGYAR